MKTENDLDSCAETAYLEGDASRNDFDNEPMMQIGTDYHEGLKRPYRTWVTESIWKQLLSGDFCTDGLDRLQKMVIADVISPKSEKQTKWYAVSGPHTRAELDELEQRSSVRAKNRQVVLIRTDAHDVDHEPDEQWINRESACAFLLHQDLMDTPNKTPLEKQLEHLLWEQCKAWHWSKWDMRSTWYLKDLKEPVTYNATAKGAKS